MIFFPLPFCKNKRESSINEVDHKLKPSQNTQARCGQFLVKIGRSQSAIYLACLSAFSRDVVFNVWYTSLVFHKATKPGRSSIQTFSKKGLRLWSSYVFCIITVDCFSDRDRNNNNKTTTKRKTRQIAKTQHTKTTCKVDLPNIQMFSLQKNCGIQGSLWFVLYLGQTQTEFR